MNSPQNQGCVQRGPRRGLAPHGRVGGGSDVRVGELVSRKLDTVTAVITLFIVGRAGGSGIVWCSPLGPCLEASDHQGSRGVFLTAVTIKAAVVATVVPTPDGILSFSGLRTVCVAGPRASRPHLADEEAEAETQAALLRTRERGPRGPSALVPAGSVAPNSRPQTVPLMHEGLRLVSYHPDAEPSKSTEPGSAGALGRSAAQARWASLPHV